MSSYSISETAALSRDLSFDNNPDQRDSQSENGANKNSHTQALSQTDNSSKNLPAIYQPKNIVGAGQLLAHKYPVEYSAESYQKARQELYYVFLGIGAYLFLVYMGWAAVRQINFTETGDFVYNAGLVGGVLMLIALAYSLFKRVTFFRRLMSADAWYYMHIACGAVGAYLVMLHSVFDLGSTNSSVAFYCMLLVIVSGALGRYALTLFSIVLHRQYDEVRNMEPELFSIIDRYDSDRTDLIHKRLTKFAVRCFKQPKGIVKYLIRLLSIPYHGIYFYVTSARQIRKIINKAAKSSTQTKAQTRLLKKAKKQQLRHYVYYIVKMGYMSLLEQLFRHWRILHVPMLYILAITAGIHVVVIHMY